ncbi:hypothetical protein PR202_gb04714 [Eleusine coracana subsp. coracana]|uniref:TCP domain-containing protein n=1 Tax=Eleusine coracana subsp. coracana TaxID=191504 RepID=A0AAV5E4I7_ELECO|nr:hypothetical protein PR202_gb04714 [Eleusine coracana subsp. coracana]
MHVDPNKTPVPLRSAECRARAGSAGPSHAAAAGSTPTRLDPSPSVPLPSRARDLSPARPVRLGAKNTRERGPMQRRAHRVATSSCRIVAAYLVPVPACRHTCQAVWTHAHVRFPSCACAAREPGRGSLAAVACGSIDRAAHVVLLHSLVKLEEDKNQLSKGLDPWSNNNNNPTGTTSTLHYLLQEKERAQAQEQLQIYHQQQQGFGGYLHPHHRRGGGGDGGVSSGESTPVDALTTAFGSGRIVRSAAGRKDRHSKVCTARGLRDRRVRLAAHTAIRFYDVQDRLGYDRPSKAVDWLIRNAKAAIDELPDRPEAATAEAAAAAAEATTEQGEQVTSTSYGFGNPAGVSFIQHSVGASDGVKSLFPSSSTASTTPAHDEYRGSPPDLLSRTTSSQPQELCLTLQSNQHQIFGHNHHHGMISSSAGVQGWPERMPAAWHASENSAAGGDGGGRGGNGDSSSSYMFGMQQRQQGLDHQSQLFSQGEPLQSSGGWASARAWLDPLAAIHQPSAMAAGQVGFSHLIGAAGGGFMGFLAPAAAQRLQGEEEQGSEAMRRD